MNLETVTAEYLTTLKELGVNKVELREETARALKNRRAPGPKKTVATDTKPKAVAAAEPASPPLALADAEKPAALAKLSAAIAANQEYRAMFKYAKNMVFGVGNPCAKIMFIGEAPGADEDEQGEPFVGRAGQLLTKMIVAMGLQRTDVYIGNIVKYRPDMPPGSSGNRKPTLNEIAISRPFICEQIRIIRPGAIVALGATAVEGLFKTGNAAISKRRGNWTEFLDIPLMPTYHPAYLLRNPVNSEKRKVWEDLLQVMERVGMPINDKQRDFFLSK